MKTDYKTLKKDTFLFAIISIIVVICMPFFFVLVLLIFGQGIEGFFSFPFYLMYGMFACIVTGLVIFPCFYYGIPLIKGKNEPMQKRIGYIREIKISFITRIKFYREFYIERNKYHYRIVTIDNEDYLVRSIEDFNVGDKVEVSFKTKRKIVYAMQRISNAEC